MPDDKITITVTLFPEVAYQLGQFCKRSTFDMFYEMTEVHLSLEERRQRAYQMTAGVEAG